jgi:predicted TIM-barrel fold metal-dependent hydrolase
MSELCARGRRGEPLDDLDIVDIHGHLGRYRGTVTDPSIESLIAVMDRVGVRTSICSHLSCAYGNARRGNEEVRRAALAFPDRILGYVTLWPASADEVRAEMDRCSGPEFVGVKLHNTNGFDYTDDAYRPALEAANERRMLLLLHTWGNDEEFSQASTLAREFTGLSVVLAHAGAVDADAYIRTASEHDNIYLDVVWSRAPLGMVDRLVAGVGAGKVLWGSDATCMSITQQIGRVLGARIPDDDKQAVLSGNAHGLLRHICR